MGVGTAIPLCSQDRQGKRFATYPPILQYCTCYALVRHNIGLPIARLYLYTPEAALY
jgi:hypothetical protein